LEAPSDAQPASRRPAVELPEERTLTAAPVQAQQPRITVTWFRRGHRGNQEPAVGPGLRSDPRHPGTLRSGNARWDHPGGFPRGARRARFPRAAPDAARARELCQGRLTGPEHPGYPDQGPG
jgi:hypothetical protein